MRGETAPMRALYAMAANAAAPRTAARMAVGFSDGFAIDRSVDDVVPVVAIHSPPRGYFPDRARASSSNVPGSNVMCVMKGAVGVDLMPATVARFSLRFSMHWKAWFEPSL